MTKIPADDFNLILGPPVSGCCPSFRILFFISSENHGFFSIVNSDGLFRTFRSGQLKSHSIFSIINPLSGHSPSETSRFVHCRCCRLKPLQSVCQLSSYLGSQIVSPIASNSYLDVQGKEPHGCVSVGSPGHKRSRGSSRVKLLQPRDRTRSPFSPLKGLQVLLQSDH